MVALRCCWVFGLPNLRVKEEPRVYKCSACRRAVGPRVPLRKLTLRHPLTSQVRQELPLCGSCLAAHLDGVTLQQLFRPRPGAGAGV